MWMFNICRFDFQKREFPKQSQSNTHKIGPLRSPDTLLFVPVFWPHSKIIRIQISANTVTFFPSCLVT